MENKTKKDVLIEDIKVNVKHYDYTAVPLEMKQANRWVLWDKDKIPYNAYTKGKAKSNDKRTWSSFDECLEALNQDVKNKYKGIGFMLGDGFACVDIDHCLPKNIGLLEEFNNELNTYMEYSQSGNGVHFFFKLNGKLPKMCRKGCIEFYDHDRYIALTGHLGSKDNTLRNDIDDKVLALHKKYISDKTNENRNNRINKQALAVINIDFSKPYHKLTDDEVIYVISRSRNSDKFFSLYYGEIGEEENHSKCDIIVCNILAFYTNHDKDQMDRLFRNSNLYRDKWDEKRGGITYGEKTINDALAFVKETISNHWGIIQSGAIDVETGEFVIPDINEYTPTERGNARLMVDNCCEDLRYIKEEGNYIYFDKNQNKWIFDNKDHNHIKTIYNSSFMRFYAEDFFIDRRQKFNEIEEKIAEIKTKQEKDEFTIEKSKEDLEKDNSNSPELAKLYNQRNELKKQLKDYIKNYQNLQSTGKMNSILSQIPTFDTKNIVLSTSDLDRYPYLLNCKNGVVDLRTGIFYENTILIDGKEIPIKDLHLTLSTNVNYDANAKCPKWKEFIKSIAVNKDVDKKYKTANKELAEFYQNALGYTITGETSEQVFFECLGKGSNGKSVLFNMIFKVMGDYATTTRIDTILANKTGATGNNATPEIAKLQGKRFLKTSEPDECSRLKEGEVKDLTGGESITARKLYGESFIFKPEFKLWFACNYRVKITGTDDGIWRRTLILPFYQKFSDELGNKNTNLEKELTNEELEGILLWLIEGAKQWYAHGLVIPQIVKDETLEYKNDQDVFNRFIEEMLITNNNDDGIKLTVNDKVYTNDAWNRFFDWTKSNREGTNIKRKKFFDEMKSRLLKEGETLFDNYRDSKGTYFPCVRWQKAGGGYSGYNNNYNNNTTTPTESDKSNKPKQVSILDEGDDDDLPF